MFTRYKEFSGLHLPNFEKEILAQWKAEKTFEKSISLREGSTPFVFYEGPPSANGMPGIHHVISRTLKDIVCRYKTMQGFQVKRKGGWDTHGLPIELGVEKELKITKEDIGKKISVEAYNQKCREAVLRYKDQWDELTEKMGYWVDLSNPYITFDNKYIETLWWILSQLYKKNLLYESISIQPYSPAAGTGLSSHELNQPGTYKEVKDTSVVAMFKALPTAQTQFLFEAAAAHHSAKEKPEIFFLAWTTTPWTLPSNLGLSVGEKIDYLCIKTFNPYTHLAIYVVLAKALVHKYFKPEAENSDFAVYASEAKVLPWKIIASFKGVLLANCTYEQLLPFEANTLETIIAITPQADPFKIILADFVTTEDGTGIVHTAPAFGADDFRVGKKNNLGLLTLVDKQGKFIEGLGEFSGRYVKNYTDDKAYVDVNIDLCVQLKKQNRAFKVEKYQHNYPHCWRTDKPIIYYPLDAWFIKTTAIKDRMIALNKTIRWKPQSTGDGRFGNWLENMVDWNLSRSRYWGTPLPIWRTEEGDEEICIASIEELNSGIKKAKELLGQEFNKNYLHDSVLDLHKPYVDDIILVSPSGKPMKRVPDLVDVWFDSGAMPYAQWHYPFENKEAFAKAFPADFIAEGVDQTRGWFYTLHAIAALLFDSVAFKTVVSNGLVLDKEGNKMSKRLGNVVNPFETIDAYGADATRWYLITNASPWDNLKFDVGGIKEVQRKFFGTLYNTYQFFALYANVDQFAFKEPAIAVANRPEIDRWILSALNTLIQQVTESLNDYEPTQAGRLIEIFVDQQLSNWYVRLCRRRFWKSVTTHNTEEPSGTNTNDAQDKIAAYQTLYECLEAVLQLVAPIAPFFSDLIFKQLNDISKRHSVASIHHTLFPIVNNQLIDNPLEERMLLAQELASLVLSLRKKVDIKVRQPLQKILIPILNPSMKDQIEKVAGLIKNEVNVKEIQYITATDGFIKKKIKPNFIALGKKLGVKMKQVSNSLQVLTQEEIFRFEKEGSFSLLIDGEPLILQLNEVELLSEDITGWMVANKGSLTVALDVTVTPDLISEGIARELVNRIQKIRKDNGFELTDRVSVHLTQHKDLNTAVAQYNAYICAEILADNVAIVSELANGTEIEVNDIPLKVLVTKKAESNASKEKSR
jgi:isoleucyl-tRNA synthetase